MCKVETDQNNFNIDRCILEHNIKSQSCNEEKGTDIEGPVKVDAEKNCNVFEDCEAAADNAQNFEPRKM